jgi:sugar-specific transcriptional regulator TrmB
VTTGIVAQEKSGRENLYRVVEPELVARVLIQHRESFFDDVVDRFAEVWTALEPRAAIEEPGGGAPPGGLLLVFHALARACFV